MPATACPFDGCGYKTDDLDPILAAAQLNIHALSHTQKTATGAVKQKPPKINRPTICKDTTEEDWNTFLKKWELFKNGTDIPNAQVSTHLWQCCDPDLEADLFKDVPDIYTVPENDLLEAIKKLSVISVAASVRRTELLSLKQDHSQPIRSFAAKVKGKAQTCAFHKECTRASCTQVVDYTPDIVKYVVLSGIVDEDIKKEVLGTPDLDNMTLNDTISLIENKEMASRAITQADSTVLNLTHNNAISSSTQKDLQSKLALKRQCKRCNKTIQRFKLRKNRDQQKVLREFETCVDCWRQENPKPVRDSAENKPNPSTTGALFDAITAVNVASSTNSPQAQYQRLKLDHHIFDGSYGWMIAESKPQPTLQLRIHTNRQDYDHLNLPCPNVKSKSITAITDTGAQSSLMGLKTYLKCGFKRESLLPVKRKMYAANNEGIRILGATFARLSGTDKKGGRVETAEMVYITDSTDLFYLSRRAMEELGIINHDFPSIGTSAQTAIYATKPQNIATSNHCECLKRMPPPTRPTYLPFEATMENNGKMKQWLLDRFASSTFNKCPHHPLPMMTGPPIEINIDPLASPTVVHSPAPIPIHWRDEIKKQLDDDVNLGVIEKVEPNSPSTWCHRAIWTRKTDGSPRRVVDYQSLNRHCTRDTHHTVPPFQQARMIPPNTYRSVTDAWNGYHSVPVRKEDRHLLTFITEFGRYRYRVAPQGYIASGDGYTHRYDRIIADIPRKTKCVDDTVLWDTSLEDHWWRMIDYLELMGKEGIVLNPSKFQFAETKVNFAGFRITEQDVRPLNKYLDSIKHFPTPTRIADIRAWFGLVNQVSHYGKLTEIMLPFKPLLSPKTPFRWTDELDSAFNKSKVEIVKAIEEGVRIFDPIRKTCLSPDWSKTGIGYWLRQQYCDCHSETPECCKEGWRITLAGSRFLRTHEKRYAPIEGEALAIAWALEDTKFFTLGCDKLVVATDHKPLTRIFCDRSLEDITNDRIFRLKQRTLMWRFEIVHVPGKSIPASDATSRNPAHSPDNDEGEWMSETDYIGTCADYDSMERDMVATNKSSLENVHAVTWERVRDATISDGYLRQLKQYIINGFPTEIDNLPPQLQPYWRHREELSIVDQVVMYGERIVIPPSLRPNICQNLHSAHQGTTSMSERARATVFWPGISSSIQAIRDKCDTCWRIAPSQPNLPPVEPTIPSIPFEAVAADYFMLHGHHYLVIIDRLSNWPQVMKITHNPTNAGAKGLIRALKRTFATFGVPNELSSDGGPEFTAAETTDFLYRWGVKHRLSSAYNPRSNGRAEVAVKAMKRLLRDNITPSGEIDSENYTRAILQFRNTPDPNDGLSPSEIVFGRPLRDVFPFKPRTQIFESANVKPAWKQLWRQREETLQHRSHRQLDLLNEKTRHLQPLIPGDCCRIQNQKGRFPSRWDKTGTVVQVNEHDQYVMKMCGSNRLTLRNRKYLRKIENAIQPAIDLPTLPTSTVTTIPSTPPRNLTPTTETNDNSNSRSEPTPSNLTPHDDQTSGSKEMGTNDETASTPTQQPPDDESETPSAATPSRPVRERRKPTWHKDYEIGAMNILE